MGVGLGMTGSSGMAKGMNMIYMMHMNEAGTGRGFWKRGVIYVRGLAAVGVDSTARGRRGAHGLEGV